MLKSMMKYLPALAWLAMTLLDSSSTRAEDAVKRGEYLVHVISCGDCHTPGSLAGKPDMARYLGGCSIGFQIPGLGVFYAPNLTPDPETGLGKWSEADIVTALRTVVRPNGRARRRSPRTAPCRLARRGRTAPRCGCRRGRRC